MNNDNKGGDKMENKKQMKKNFYVVGEAVWSKTFNSVYLIEQIVPKSSKVIIVRNAKDGLGHATDLDTIDKLSNSTLDKMSAQYRQYMEHNIQVYANRKQKLENKLGNIRKKSNLTGLDHAFAQVRKWHRKFNNPVADAPQALEKERAFNRTVWTAEELLEYLYATVGGNLDEFDDISARFIARLQDNVQKIKTKKPVIDDVLVGQVDALTDAEYFLKGTWTETGVYPQEMFDIVQAANMGKIFPDGSVHYDQFEKIIKPDNWEKDFAPEPKLRKAIQGQIERATAKQQK